MGDESLRESLRKLPGIDKLLESIDGKKFIELYNKIAATIALRKAVERIRSKIISGDLKYAELDEQSLNAEIFELTGEYFRPRLKSIINATGVIVHTNFGRAPLADEAMAAINEIGDGYSNLEYDVEKGSRGSRQSIVDEFLIDIVDSEAAMVVNNNAGAVFLSLIALARDREVIVSRGELVEIGGSFRIPDVLAASGAKMIEVGTTNKTRISDYANAINERTAMILKVHRSNFYIRGFTQEASHEELAALADENKLYFMVDLGSGCFIDTAKFGLPHEPTPAEVIKQGAHFVTFSGDKLLGGPQAGIIAGRGGIVAALRKHPVHRALRVDKCSLAALEATLKIYLSGRAESDIPVINMIAQSSESLNKTAVAISRKLSKDLDKLGGRGFDIEVTTCTGRVGGGAIADGEIGSWAVCIRHLEIRPEKIFAALLASPTPIVGRIQDERLLLDVRTLWNIDVNEFCAIISDALKSIIAQ